MTFADRCRIMGVRMATSGMVRTVALSDALAILRFSRIGRVKCVRAGMWVPE